MGQGMRRGLMGWNAEELPIGVLNERIGRLRVAMQSSGLQALLIYTNLVRPSAVSYLTGFTPYWSDGILLVGRAGSPTLATALSRRVAGWVRSVSPVGEIVNSPRPAAVVGERIAGEDAGQRVGVLEFDAFPSGYNDDLVAAAPRAEFIDATAMFASVRRGTDAAERKLLGRVDAIATQALDQVGTDNVASPGEVAGLVEKRARLEGAEEAYVAVAPDLAADRRMIRASPAMAFASLFALRASIAYKGHWVRRTRTLANDPAAQLSVSRADQWFAEVIASIEPKPLGEQVGASVRRCRGAALVSWMAESCVGSYPLQVIAGSRSPAGACLANNDFLVLTIELVVEGVPWLGAAPAIVGAAME